ncbi:MAG: radical SAM protein [Candidatus Omnitrophica bacterium]|nr:radical SAM protein [Candidatus Omnitrophota bacterium]
MKILLATGYIPKKKQITRLPWMKYCPPLGLGYIAAVLQERGQDVSIVDCLALQHSLDEIVDCIVSQKPDIVGISVMSTTYEGAVKISKQIKKKINVPIVFGGPHCSSFPIRTMEQCPDVDFLVYGEGESIFPLLIEAISGSLSYFDVPQLCFRGSDGNPILNKQERLVEDLDKIPFPARHLFNKPLYPANTYTLVTSRGCSYGKCAFCARTGLLYEKYRRRSVASVIKELESLCRGAACDKVVFLDDNFAQDDDWVVEFCDNLIQKGLAFKWHCRARVDTITEKMIEKMAFTGCDMIMYGIESGSQSMLDYIEKGTSIQQARHAIKITRQFGIKTWGYFILGLPKETPELGKQTVRFAIDLDLDIAQFTPAMAFPGTRLYDLCKQEGGLIDDSNDFYDTSISAPILMPQIRFVPKAYNNKTNVASILKFAYIKFYLRFSYIKRLLKNKEGRFSPRQLVDAFLFFIRIIFSKLY